MRSLSRDRNAFLLSRATFFPLLAALLSGLATQPGSAQDGSVPVFNPANGHWYQAIAASRGVTWPAARAAAEARSFLGARGHLVTLTSVEENRFVINNLPLSRQAHWWLGGYQDGGANDYLEPGGGWRWVTAEPWSYAHWYPNQPDNYQSAEHAIEIDTRYGNRWNDRAPSTRLGGYVVEYEPLPRAGSALVQILPNPVVGGASASGQVTLAAPARLGGTLFVLLSSNPAAAVVPAVVLVGGGSTTASFPVATFGVSAPTEVVITAIGLPRKVKASLRVLPTEAAPTPEPPTPEPPTPEAPSNLLINGSFEEPPVSSDFRLLEGPEGLPGWRLTAGNVEAITQNYWQPAPSEGTQSLDLVGISAGRIEQSFATVAGKEYLFSGWIAHNADNPIGPEGRADVFVNGQFFVQLFHRDAQATRSEMRWQAFSHRFQATSDTTTLALADVTNLWAGGGLVLDGLAVKEVTGGG